MYVYIYIYICLTNHMLPLLPAGKMPLERGALYLARGSEREKRGGEWEWQRGGRWGSEVGSGGRWGNEVGKGRSGRGEGLYDAPMKMGSCSLPLPPSFSCLSSHLLPQPPDCMFPAPQYNVYASPAGFLLQPHDPNARCHTMSHLIAAECTPSLLSKICVRVDSTLGYV